MQLLPMRYRFTSVKFVFLFHHYSI
uniref:Uncharacterized protein n=1 Tax=Anguilla anguilla TaxID=7936 RepID=A0A0E9QT22_ANGAN